MKEETKEKIAAIVGDWAYIKDLPKEWFGFQRRYEMHEENDYYDIFSYHNNVTRRKITVYYHEETKEYKARITVGLTEFCNIDFITSNLTALENILKDRFERTLRNLAIFDQDNIDSILIEKKILEWKYIDRLPKTIEGFTLFIRPNEPLRSINGSYIIFDYSDFAAESNFIIYYNIFRDEFFGESRIRRIPEMNYVFDTHELIDLEEKLDLHLFNRLKAIRQHINETGKEALKC